MSNVTKNEWTEIDNILIVDNKGENLLKRKYHSIDYYPRATFDSFMDLTNDSNTKKINTLSRTGVTFPIKFQTIDLKNMNFVNHKEFNSIDIRFEEKITVALLLLRNSKSKKDTFPNDITIFLDDQLISHVNF